jgi:YHS domain-containing protein
MSDVSTRRLSRRAVLVLGVTAMLASAAARAAQPPINTLTGGFFGGAGDTAILGYDTVAYFTEGKPVKGSDSFVATWMGAKWKFASQAHLDLFKAAPEKYAPQYGGYCAYGVAVDNLVSIEPDKFKVIDGKLYLNYDAGVQEKWLKNPIGFIKTADSKFQTLLKQ